MKTIADITYDEKEAQAKRIRDLEKEIDSLRVIQNALITRWIPPSLVQSAKDDIAAIKRELGK